MKNNILKIKIIMKYYDHIAYENIEIFVNELIEYEYIKLFDDCYKIIG